ncbi:MAG: hypothetical protein H6R16_3608, partial [Proteobacteria bacterium]|nr:hypothetical protein [Pseudomonadota bacterium]
QLVERNLAKVEVESSRLFCRSKYRVGDDSSSSSMLPKGPFFGVGFLLFWSAVVKEYEFLPWGLLGG